MSAATQMVVYHGPTLGFLASPPGEGSHPAIVVIHEWWGLNDQVQEQTRLLAEAGYVALAVDLYGGRCTRDPNEAMALMTGVDMAVAIANMQAAVAYLRARPGVDAAKVCCIGWCFGGACSLKLALAQKDLAGCVIYYGVQLETDPEILRGAPPILGNFGAEDDSPPPERVKAFEAALEAAGVTHDIKLFDGAGHAFANPTQDQRFRPQQAEAAWSRTLAFLQKI